MEAFKAKDRETQGELCVHMLGFDWNGDRGETHTGPSFLLLLVSLQYQSFFLKRKPELSRRKMFKREREKLDSDLLRCYDSPWVSGVPSFFDFGEGDY